MVLAAAEEGAETAALLPRSARRLGASSGRWWVMAATAGILVCMVTWANAGSYTRLAQGSQPEIRVPATIVAGPATQVSLPIQVGPPGGVPRSSFIRLRGLPPSVSLTEGHSIAPGSWSVPLNALPSLQVYVPSALAGRSEISVTLVTVDGVVVAEAHTSFVVASSSPEQQPQDALQSLPSEEKERAKKLVAQGEHYLSMGNLPVARQFFERAAGIGYAPGALRLATTFDPAELAQLGVRGAVPDLAEARKWYERARALGAAEAADRLARLTKNY